MAAQREDRQRMMWVMGQIPEPQHYALARIATVEGKQLIHIVAEAVARYIVLYDKEHENAPVAVRAVAAQQKHLERQNVIAIIKQLVYMQAEFPAEERLEEIRKLADDMGVNLDQLIAEVEGNRLVAAVLSTRGYIDPVQQFLLEQIPRAGSVPAKEIQARAAKAGFSEWKIDAEKGRLGIVSKRDKNQWVWMWPTGFDPEAHLKQLLSVMPTVEDNEDVIAPVG